VNFRRSQLTVYGLVEFCAPAARCLVEVDGADLELGKVKRDKQADSLGGQVCLDDDLYLQTGRRYATAQARWPR
jgi:hypothetical protein